MDDIQHWRLLCNGRVIRKAAGLWQLRRSPGGVRPETLPAWSSRAQSARRNAQDQSFADLELALELVLEELIAQSRQIEFGDMLEARVRLAKERLEPGAPATLLP